MPERTAHGWSLPEIDHRVLVAFGEDDASAMPLIEETAAALRSAGADSVLLDKCGHLWQECPDQFYPGVRAFLGLAESQ